MSQIQKLHPSGTLKSEKAVEIRITVPWGYIAAKAWGNSESKSPILGIHGWMDNAGTFDRLVPYLSNSFYFVAIDLPGHGLSSHIPPGLPYHLGDLIITIKRVVDYFKWSRLSIVGHSIGGGLGVYFASVFPNFVERLVMLDVISIISSDEGSTGGSMANSIDTFLALEEKVKPDFQPTYSLDEAVNRYMIGTNYSLTEESAKRLLTRGLVQVDEDKWSFRADPRTRSLFRSPMYQFSHEDSLNITQSIKCHNLIIKGTESPFWLPQDVVSKKLNLYREKCASFHYIEVKGNHFVHLNEPEKFANSVNQFLLGLQISPIIKSGL